MVGKIKKQLDKIRPYLQMDGGDIEFISFDDQSGVLKVKLQGTCLSCPMSQITLQEGVAKAIKEEVPEVKEIIAI
ncbi:MAG: hypothetical protein A3B89_04285 [Candidatus Buchananbacteria bacterium RIFCSPHIGHO2_02_FULL_40_13]|uniref:NIF system FeS cluster assembly NifU C-terminal domain-containing protein n=1 Tax=Candidatus Buchananbacteria bacterium RIFCSPLOWO2_01_FULL_39_33 TaxID=1797543 RepID=A0A1G1YKU3_9BACT|nr:MAG: hypothetical protein A2820_01990 [Candidatus Buchananbacteria bacterium RIFCSPHIGHO2_01_FULL_40_35]OGY50896.1 MAG: hypothetical protein A3B89_04285 [Candidatus Buchananbacteria bacterium RIFCSPHIGHO2_02_FULL_40_13]OGY52963.1 MAG: hypothetical protein A3A02_04460 [Candidatus Buchananbacteria bacterium RIFCSPLOWO2_01_FULL_39_33]